MAEFNEGPWRNFVVQILANGIHQGLHLITAYAAFL